jgi:hypothetical protein
MQTARTRFFAFALTLALCSCASVQWHKADGDDSFLARDLAACRTQAQSKAGITGSLGSSSPIDPRFGAPSGPSQADQMMQESQAVGFCMRDKGYTLVPDKK